MIPKYDLDLEKQIFKGMFELPTALATAMEILRSEDFFHKQHSKWFDTAREMFISGQTVDFVNFEIELKRGGKSKEDHDLLVEIIGLNYAPSGVDESIKYLKQLSLLRSLGNLSVEMSSEINKDGSDPFVIIENANDKLMEMSGEMELKRPRQIGKLVLETMVNIEEIRAGKRKYLGIETGFTKLDECLGGLEPGNLVVIAARPSIGKTALALKICSNISKHHSVVFFSQEQSEEEISIRSIAIQSKIPAWKIKNGKLSDDEVKRIYEALKDNHNDHAIIDDTSSLSIVTLQAKIRKIIHSHPISGVFIDYLGLMESQRHETRDLEIGYLTRNLKGMAKKFGIFVCVLSQLNRNVEARADKKPVLSDLRESGNIEQDADIAIFIHRPGMYGLKDSDGIAYSEQYTELIVAKNRNGATGIVKCTFIEPEMRFENLIEASRVPEEPPQDHRYEQQELPIKDNTPF